MSNLEQAYRFLYEFKEKSFGGNTLQLTEEELGYVTILAQELLPTTIITDSSETSLSDFLKQIAREDTKCNHALGNALDSFYHQVELGQEEEGRRTLREFLDICPSHWYRSHAEIELENLEAE